VSSINPIPEQPYSNDEIDLLELFQRIWEGKLTILAAMLIAVIGAAGFLKATSAAFTAKTEIKPITSVDASLYAASNAQGFFEVSTAKLLTLYIEQLEERSLLIDAVKKYQIIERNNFISDEAYEEAAIALAASIEIRPPINPDGKDKGDSRKYWELQFTHHDNAKWHDALIFINQKANKIVRDVLIKHFENSLSIAMQKKTFELHDLDLQIQNEKKDFDTQMAEFELKHRFELEDVEVQISNSLSDYDRKISDRLAFLTEQAAIARKLGVSKNTIEAQTFNAQNGVVANVKTDTPFYLRGYEAIEKEIELIKTRKDPKAFVAGLFDLENKKRALIQDQTLQRAEKNKTYLDSILNLKKKKRALEQDRHLDRAVMLFESTPIKNPKSFKATSTLVESTDYESKRKSALILAVSLVLGGFIGMIVVLIRGALQARKPTA